MRAQQRKRISMACRMLAHTGHGDTLLGHISERIETTDRFWIKGAGYGLDEVLPEQLLCMNTAGEQIEGQGRPHQEWPIHAAIYQANPDVRVVVHTHAMSACLVSSLEGPLLPLSYEGALFAPDNIAYFRRTAHLISTPALGHEVASVLGNKQAMLLRNHGLITAGASLEEACVLAIYLEKACQMQIQMLQMQSPYLILDRQEIEEKRTMYRQAQLSTKLWDYYCRNLPLL